MLSTAQQHAFDMSSTNWSRRLRVVPIFVGGGLQCDAAAIWTFCHNDSERLLITAGEDQGVGR